MPQRERTGAVQERGGGVSLAHQRPRGQFVPVWRAQDTVKRLNSQGMSVRAIAAAAGLSASTVSTISRGAAAYVCADTVDRLEGVTVNAMPAGNRVPAALASAVVGKIRAAGFSRAEVNRMMRRNPTTKLPGEGYNSVEYAAFDRVMTLYRLLARRGLVDATLVREIAS